MHLNRSHHLSDSICSYLKARGISWKGEGLRAHGCDVFSRDDWKMFEPFSGSMWSRTVTSFCGWIWITCWLSDVRVSAYSRTKGFLWLNRSARQWGTSILLLMLGTQVIFQSGWLFVTITIFRKLGRVQENRRRSIDGKEVREESSWNIEALILWMWVYSSTIFILPFIQTCLALFPRFGAQHKR